MPSPVRHAVCHAVRPFVRTLACVAGLLGVAAPATAGTVSHTATVGDLNGPTTLALFDTSLGTLQSVRLEAAFDFDVRVAFTEFCGGFNFTGCNAPISGELSASADFQRGTVTLNLFDHDAGTEGCLVAYLQTGNCVLGLGVQDAAWDEANDASTLAAFSGSGSFAFSFMHSLSWLGGDLSDPLGNLGQVVVTYRYLDAVQDVPEPGSLALTAAAGLALLGTRRSRAVRTTR